MNRTAAEEIEEILATLDSGRLEGILQMLRAVRDAEARAGGADGGQDEESRRPELEQQLLGLVETLTAPEIEVVLSQLQLAKSANRVIDPVSIFHESLKARIEQLMDFEEISTAQAPSVIKQYPEREKVRLPEETLPLPFTLDKVIRARASRRDFSYQPLTLAELSTLFQYTYGIRTYFPAYNSRTWPMRFVPSSGALQAVELYAIVNHVDELRKGLYHYNPIDHSLELLNEGNMRWKITRCCLFQEWLQHASVVLVLTCNMKRVEWKYGPRGYRYIHIDTGIVTNSLYLVATALRLRTCAVAAFLDDAVNDLLQIDGRDEFVSLLVAVGKRPFQDDSGRGDAEPPGT
jgi:SagB-type dehydrogenase family enzyme